MEETVLQQIHQDKHSDITNPEQRDYDTKVRSLYQDMEQYAKHDMAMAFSGGVDSSLLLKIAAQAAKKYNTTIHAITAQTRLHPQGDLDTARKVAEEIGAVFHVVEIDELNETGIENNPVDRCYRCKKGIFQRIKDVAHKEGIDNIMEGTNEDDLHEYRPGIRALKELSVISPLAENGLTKSDVRRLAKTLGISVANRPSSPCLATRIPYGDAINYDILDKVAKGEEYIRNLKYYNVRLRVHNNVVRIEVDGKDLYRIIEQKEEIIGKIKELGFDYITLDLEGFRSGSMDVGLK